MKIIILVADDEERVRELLVFLLESSGYGVLQAKDTDEALMILESEKVDIVFTDGVMPGDGGLVVARRSKTLCPNRPVILSSGTVTLEESLSAGVDAVLPKPYLPKDLRVLIERLANEVRERQKLEIVTLDTVKAFQTEVDNAFLISDGADETLQFILAYGRLMLDLNRTIVEELGIQTETPLSGDTAIKARSKEIFTRAKLLVEEFRKNGRI